MQYITSFSRGTGSKTGSTHIVNPENNRKTVFGQTIMFPSPCGEDVMSTADDLMGAIAKRDLGIAQSTRSRHCLENLQKLPLVTRPFPSNYTKWHFR